jgi:hypothetical protein
MPETKEQYLSRLMNDPQMLEEFPDEKTRKQVAQEKYENKSSEVEFKSAGTLEIKDLNVNKRTAVIAHAVYDVVDRAFPVPDISRKGMFNKSWHESKSRGIEDTLGFYINHDPLKQPGLVKDVWETENKAYTKVWFGTHTLGQDTMIMMDEGIIRDASFSFKAIRREIREIKGKKVRELKEVLHGETSVVIGIPPVNPLAGVVSVTKAMTPESIMVEFKNYVERMESFTRNSRASDDAIININNEIKTAKEFISSYDTANTREIPAPSASVRELSTALRLLTLKI